MLKLKTISAATNLIFLVVFTYSCHAGKSATMKNTNDYKSTHEAKVKVNDDTIGVIIGVINYVCPKLIDPSVNICNPDDPVGSAVAIQKQMGDIDELDELDPDELEITLKQRQILHVGAALQFYDAVEQFKLHYPFRAKAIEFAKKGQWYDAQLNEEQAWQYLVKTANRGILAKKMVDGE